LIRSGGDNLASTLNLGRLSQELKELACDRVDEIDGRRQDALRMLLDAIDAGRLDPSILATALI